jgi:hypothetical protein
MAENNKFSVDLSTKIAAPFTSIVNRARMVDLANDVQMRFGVNRIQTQEVFELSEESGSNGEKVFGVVNDKFNQIRFIGDWGSNNNNVGAFIQGTTGDVEITFFGTGLNVLGLVDNSVRDLRIEIDGGGLGADIYGAYSGVLTLRGYGTNQVFNLASGLTLGIHTIRVSFPVANTLPIYGFEILNESTQINVRPGFAKVNDAVIQVTGEDIDYASGFDNTFGTPGTKGGCVQTYVKPDGTVGKDVRYTEVSQLNLAAADHSNEEIIAKHYWREFGAGRADDFSTLITTSDKAFTLDDGTTTLVGQNVEINDGALSGSGDDDFWTLTFIGTGLDLITLDSQLDRRCEVFIDGFSVGFVTGTYAEPTVRKIVSGLPYGTHTVKFVGNHPSNPAKDLVPVTDFIIYGPKKPTTPTGTMPDGSYYLMADFVANDTTGELIVPQGTIRKTAEREMIYTGTWSHVGLAINRVNGINLQTTAAAATMEYTFYGTGFNLRLGVGAGADITIEVDGSTDISSFISSSGNGVITPATGAVNWVGGSDDDNVRVSGMALGLHTVKITSDDVVVKIMGAIDVITPIHSPKLNGPFVKQNTLRVGSMAIGDDRCFDEGDVEDTSFLTKCGYVSVANTSSTTLVPVNDMLATINMEESGLVKINWNFMARNSSASQFLDIDIFVDGKSTNLKRYFENHAINEQEHIKCEEVVYLNKGIHTIQAHWLVEGGTATHNGESELTVHKV